MQLDLQAAAAFEALAPAAVAERVRAVLAEQKVSAAEVARRCGWLQPYIARRLKPESKQFVPFSATDLVSIAEALDVDPKHLMPEPAVSAR